MTLERRGFPTPPGDGEIGTLQSLDSNAPRLLARVGHHSPSARVACSGIHPAFSLTRDCPRSAALMATRASPADRPGTAVKVTCTMASAASTLLCASSSDASPPTSEPGLSGQSVSRCDGHWHGAREVAEHNKRRCNVLPSQLTRPSCPGPCCRCLARSRPPAPAQSPRKCARSHTVPAPLPAPTPPMPRPHCGGVALGKSFQIFLYLYICRGK